MFKSNKKGIDLVLVSLLLILNIFPPFFSVYIVDFEQVNDCWEIHAPKVNILFLC